VATSRAPSANYDHVLASSPDHVLARYNRAVARERQHDIAGALADMDALLAVSPDYANAYAMRARYRAALGRRRRGARGPRTGGGRCSRRDRRRAGR
jgi:hypothetical protein